MPHLHPLTFCHVFVQVDASFTPTYLLSCVCTGSCQDNQGSHDKAGVHEVAMTTAHVNSEERRGRWQHLQLFDDPLKQVFTPMSTLEQCRCHNTFFCTLPSFVRSEKYLFTHVYSSDIWRPLDVSNTGCVPYRCTVGNFITWLTDAEFCAQSNVVDGTIIPVNMTNYW